MQQEKTRNWARVGVVGLVIVLVGVLSRILPHPNNFTPLIALALFGGAQVKNKKLAVVAPLAAMLLSDVVLYLFRYPSYLNWEALRTAGWVYGSLAVICCMGMWLERRQTFAHVAGATLAGSLLFFLVTNFGVWYDSGWYSHTFSGLVACYVAALPFFQNQLVATVLFCGVLFGATAAVEGRLTNALQHKQAA